MAALIKKYDYGPFTVAIYFHKGEFRGVWYVGRQEPKLDYVTTPYNLGYYNDPKEAKIGSLARFQGLLSRVGDGLSAAIEGENTPHNRFYPQEWKHRANLNLEDYVDLRENVEAQAEAFRKEVLLPLIEKVDTIHVDIPSSRYDYTTLKTIFSGIIEYHKISVWSDEPTMKMVKDLLFFKVQG